MSKLDHENDEDIKIESVEVGQDSETDLNAPGFVLTDENITQEQINEMKMLGLDRPPGVSYKRWWMLQDIRYEHEHMIHLAASGLPQQEIARMLGYDNLHVSKVLKTPFIKEKVDQKIAEIYGEDIKKALRDRARKAVGVVDKILVDGKEAEQASMAKWVLEHTVGKASQEINVQKTTLHQVIMEVNQLKSGDKLRDVGSSTELLQNSKDHFDTIIEQVIPEGMVVGKRSEGTDEGKG